MGQRLSGLTCVLMVALIGACAREKETPKVADAQWVNPSTIQAQPTRVSRLSNDQLARVRRIHTLLSEVDPSSLDKWIADFEKDRDPEREIRLWEAMAEAYQSYSSTHALSLDGKQEVLQVLLIRSMTADEGQVLKQSKLRVLTPRQARDVMATFRGNAVPIEVERK